MRARQERRRRELQELGTVVAIAFNEPNKLDSAFRPTIEETADRAEKNPDEWDYDEWWKSAD